MGSFQYANIEIFTLLYCSLDFFERYFSVYTLLFLQNKQNKTKQVNKKKKPASYFSELCMLSRWIGILTGLYTIAKIFPATHL